MLLRNELILKEVFVFTNCLQNTYQNIKTSAKKFSFYQTNSISSVPKYTPTKVNGPIKIMDGPTKSELSLDAFGENLQFDVSLNKNLVADNHVTEFVDAGGKATKLKGLLLALLGC